MVVVYSGRQDLPSNARTFSLISLLFFPTPSPLFYLRHHLTLVPKPHGNFCYAGYHLTLQGSRRRQFSQKIPVYSLDISHSIVLWSICGYVTSVFTFCQGLLRVSRWVSVITCFLVMPSCSRVWLSWFQLTSKYFNLLQPCEGNTAKVYSRTSANGHFFWRTVHTLACEQQTHFRSSLLRPEIRLLFAGYPYIDSCLNLSATAIFFCPQGSYCGEVQLYYSWINCGFLLLTIKNKH